MESKIEKSPEWRIYTEMHPLAARGTLGPEALELLQNAENRLVAKWGDAFIAAINRWHKKRK